MINVLTALWFSFPGLVEALHVYALVLVLELDLSVTGARKGHGTIKFFDWSSTRGFISKREALPRSRNSTSQVF
jgi:hypothetical protein